MRLKRRSKRLKNYGHESDPLPSLCPYGIKCLNDATLNQLVTQILNDKAMQHKTVIIVAKNIKESKEIARINYLGNAEYVKPYHYGSKGNNFYEYKLKK